MFWDLKGQDTFACPYPPHPCFLEFKGPVHLSPLCFLESKRPAAFCLRFLRFKGPVQHLLHGSWHFKEPECHLPWCFLRFERPVHFLPPCFLRVKGLVCPGPEVTGVSVPFQIYNLSQNIQEDDLQQLQVQGEAKEVGGRWRKHQGHLWTLKSGGRGRGSISEPWESVAQDLPPSPGQSGL